MKTKIKEFIQEHGTATLQELYAAIPDKTVNSVRGMVNHMVKNGELNRIKRATYSMVADPQ